MKQEPLKDNQDSEINISFGNQERKPGKGIQNDIGNFADEESILGNIADEEFETDSDEEAKKSEDDNLTDKKPPEDEYTEIEQKALRLGWNPNYTDGKRRNAEDWLEWRDATQKFRNQSKEIKSLRKTVEQLNDFLLNRHKEEQKTVLADLKIKRDQAVEVGDYEKFKKFDEEYQKAVLYQAQNNINHAPYASNHNPEANLAKQNVQKALEDPLVVDWLNKNPWARPSASQTSEERKMREWARINEEEYLLKNPTSSYYDALLYAEKAVREKFPNNFYSSFKYNSVESSRAIPVKENKRKVTMNDLNPKARAVIRRMIKVNNGKITEQQYIDELIKSGAIKYER